MVRFEETILCDGCGVEIFWSPVVKGKKTFCCEDCRKYGSCDCRNRQDVEDEPRSHNIPAVSTLLNEEFDL